MVSEVKDRHKGKKAHRHKVKAKNKRQNAPQWVGNFDVLTAFILNSGFLLLNFDDRIPGTPYLIF